MASLYPIRLRNLSASRQNRWASFMVPKKTLDIVGIHSKAGIAKPTSWLWQRGANVGDQVRMWLRCDLQGHELTEIDLADFRDVADVASLTSGVRFDWLLDDPAKTILQLTVDGASYPLNFDSVTEAGELVSVFRFRAAGLGLEAVAYVTVPVDSDVYDVQGYVVGCNPQSSSFVKSCTLAITHGQGHAPHLIKSLGQSQPVAGRAPHVLLSAGTLPDGFGLPFFFSIIAEPDGKQDLDYSLRATSAQAALGGPILALAGTNCWMGHIGPHGASVPYGAKPVLPRDTGFVDALRDVWAGRPWANARSSGQTGDQGCFGRIKALHLFAGADPAEIMPLRYGSTDYWVRAHHMLDADGLPLPWSMTDAERKTYETQPFYRTTGSAWKQGVENGWAPYGYDHERGGLDPQHRGNLYAPTAAAIVGDFISKDELDFLLAIECRDTRHGGQGDGSIEAPRASGRLLQEWAHWWISANETQRAHLETLADRMFAIVESQPTWKVDGPVKVTQAISKYEGKNPLRNTTNPDLGHDAWIPWQESFLVDGLTAWAMIWQRTSQYDKMSKYLAHAVSIANTVVDQGIIEHPTWGAVVVTYAKSNLGGDPNPSAYFTLPRAGAKTTLEGDADMIYGGIGLTWYSGAILCASATGNQKAIRLRNVLYSQMRNQPDWEWMVGDLS
jgi:hypothetical protein